MYFDSKRYDTLVRAYRVLMAVAVLCGVYIITLLILSGVLQGASQMEEWSTMTATLAGAAFVVFVVALSVSATISAKAREMERVRDTIDVIVDAIEYRYATMLDGRSSSEIQKVLAGSPSMLFPSSGSVCIFVSKLPGGRCSVSITRKGMSPRRYIVSRHRVVQDGGDIVGIYALESFAVIADFMGLQAQLEQSVGLLGREHAGRTLMGVDLFYDRA